MRKTIEWIKEVLKICADMTTSVECKNTLYADLKKSYDDFNIMEKLDIENTILAALKSNDAIYVFSQLLYYIDIYEFRRGVFRAILLADLDFWQGAMLEIQILKYSTGFFSERKILHKKNVESAKKIIRKKYQYINKRFRNHKRIVIVTEQLLNDLHAPTQVILNFSYILQEMLGYEIVIFVCPSNASKILEGIWYNHVGMNSDMEYQMRPIEREYMGVVLNGYQIDMSYGNTREYCMMLDYIYHYNPLCVLDLGRTNPIIDLVADFTTLVSMGMTLQCPISESQLIVRFSKLEEEIENMYIKELGNKQEQLFLSGNIPVIVKKDNEVFLREDNNLPQDKFLIAIVGNRLDEEISNEFVDIMKEILQDCPDVGFVIIGIVNKIKKIFCEKEIDGKIFYLGYCSNLMGTYGMLDLYLNPIRQGGGFSSSMALSADIPVVTLPYCDVAYNVGEEFIVYDREELVEQVCRYAKDKNFYDEKVELAKLVAKNNSIEKLRDYVEELMDGIVKHTEEERDC